MQLTEANSLDVITKEYVLQLLINEGYGTYAQRLKEFQFHVADFFKGTFCAVAFMVPSTGDVVINPGFCVDMESFGPIFSQISVIIRHELLHFLLCHEKRLIDHLKKTDPDFKKTYSRADIHTLANFAMDYDLGNGYYDEHDKEVVKMATLNGRAIHGLLVEEMVVDGKTEAYGNGLLGREVYTGVQFNNWENKSMEEMFQMLRDAHEKLMAENGREPDGSDPNNSKSKTKVNIKGTTHSQEYTDIYNKVMKLYADPKYSVADIEKLLADVQAGTEIAV